VQPTISERIEHIDFVVDCARLLRPAAVNRGMTLPKNPPVDIDALTKDLRAGSP